MLDDAPQHPTQQAIGVAPVVLEASGFGVSVTAIAFPPYAVTRLKERAMQQ